VYDHLQALWGLKMQDPVEVLIKAWNTVCQDGSLRVVRIEGESGLGKTYALQRFYDTLADSSDGYFGVGLCPTTIPTRSHLDETRRRLLDPDLLDPSLPPTWMWLGVKCLPGLQGPTGLGGDSQVGQLVDQLAFHVAYLQATYGALGDRAALGVGPRRRSLRLRKLWAALGPHLGRNRGENVRNDAKR
jgi:hypothetical protein